MTEKTKGKARAKAKPEAAPLIWIALTGLNYGDPERRVEAGEEVSDLPAESIDWLVEQGHIRQKEEGE